MKVQEGVRNTSTIKRQKYYDDKPLYKRHMLFLVIEKNSCNNKKLKRFYK
jgi:hypothetical protein